MVKQNFQASGNLGGNIVNNGKAKQEELQML